jgi:7-cyano-7-deazaguanine synthase
MTKTKALVIFSGGQDSTTCLFWAIKNFDVVEAVAFNYGQRHHTELGAAAEIAEMAGINFETLQLPLLNQITENSLTRKNRPVEHNPGLSTPNTLVTGRNLLFLTYAAIYAKNKGIKNLVTGVSQTDYSGYPDCRDTFIRSANVTLNLAMDYEFIIHTPLMHLSKCQTWEMANELGVFNIVKEKTVTCYEGIPGKGCEKCPSCLLREKGLKEYEQLKTDIR